VSNRIDKLREHAGAHSVAVVIYETFGFVVLEWKDNPEKKLTAFYGDEFPNKRIHQAIGELRTKIEEPTNEPN